MVCKMRLKAEKLSKKYKNRIIVDNVTIEIESGEVVGLLGPNGAGKTTTFYMVVGIIKPDYGDIYLGDRIITNLPMYKKSKIGIGYLTQETSIFRGLSVEDNLISIVQMLNVSKNEEKNIVDKLIFDFGFTKLRKQCSLNLSGGEKRRLEIARAMISNPKFLFLDEPFAGIDPLTVDDIQKIIVNLKNDGIGIFITDHNVREILEIIDRAYIIYDGKILFNGSVEELLKNKKAKNLYFGDNFKM
jgi:lipopolysaccharide export system ATP-binding protein